MEREREKNRGRDRGNRKEENDDCSPEFHLHSILDQNLSCAIEVVIPGAFYDDEEKSDFSLSFILSFGFLIFSHQFWYNLLIHYNHSSTVFFLLFLNSFSPLFFFSLFHNSFPFFHCFLLFTRIVPPFHNLNNLFRPEVEPKSFVLPTSTHVS